MIILNSNLTEADSRVRFFVIVHTADVKSCSVQNTKNDDERNSKENTGLSEASRIHGRSVSLNQLSSNRLLYSFWFNNALDHILHLNSHRVLLILDSKQKRERNTKKYNIEKVSKLPWKIREKKRIGYIIVNAINKSFSWYFLID